MNEPEFDPYQPPLAPVGFETGGMPEAEVPEGSPWSTIWTRPRGTIRGIVEANPRYNVLTLATLSGFSNGLSQLFQSHAGDKLSMPEILIGAGIGGAIGGILGLYLMGFLLRWTGSWLGGTANGEEVRSAIAWSSVPNVAILPIILLAVAVFKEDFFRTGGLDELTPERALLLIAVGLSMIVLGLWAGFLNIKCLAEVHRFSAWKGLGALLLAGVIVLAIALLTVLMISGLGPGMKLGG